MSSYRRDRPQINVVAIGHTNAGKTTLAAAMTRVMAERAEAPRTRAQNVSDIVPTAKTGPTNSVRAAVVAYETPARWVLHGDPAGAVKRFRTTPRTVAGCDAAILVVAADTGVMPQTREHLYWARAGGIERVVVFVNKCDIVRDDEQLSIVEGESREALTAAGFAGDEATVLRGCARHAYDGDPVWARGLDELADVLDHEIPQPSRDEGGPLVMQVEVTHRPRAAGNGEWLQCVTAYVRRGTVKRGDTVQLVANGSDALFEVRDLEIERSKVSQAVAGDLVGLLLRMRTQRRMVGRRLLRRGPLLVKPDLPELASKFTASVSLLTQKQGGRHTALPTNAVVQVVMAGTAVSGRIAFPADVPTVAPGGSVDDARLVLLNDTRVVPGMRFFLRDGCDGLRRALGGEARWSGTCAVGVVRTVG